MKKNLTIFSVMLFAMSLITWRERPAQAQANMGIPYANTTTFEISGESASPDPVHIVSVDYPNSATTVTFSVTLGQAGESGDELEAAHHVASQSYTLSAGNNGIITSVTANGTTYNPNQNTFTWAVSGGNDGNDNTDPNFDVTATIKYTAFSAAIGDKAVKMTGTVTFDDGTPSIPDTERASPSGEVDLTAFDLDITDTSGNPVKTGKTVIGKHVQLIGRVRPSLGSTIRWNITGTVVGGYTLTKRLGIPIPVSGSSITGSATSYYYWTPGSYETDYIMTTGSDTIDPDPSTIYTTSCTYNVAAPVEKQYYAMTSVDGVLIGASDGTFPAAMGDPGYPNGTYPVGTIFVQFGKAKLNDNSGQHIGILLVGDVYSPLPNGVSGQFGLLQLVSPNDYTITSGKERMINSDTLPKDNKYALDDGASGGEDIIDQHGNGQGGHTVAALDNPGVSTQNVKTSTISEDEAFEDYFMFKPDGGDSIWVTIAKLNWNWHGTGNRVNHVFKPGNPVADYSHNPSGSAGTEVPVWYNDVANLPAVYP